MPKTRMVTAGVIGALATVSLQAATAHGQAQPFARYGGGEMVDKPIARQFNGRNGDANISLITRDDAGAAFVVASALHPCGTFTGQAYGSGETPLAPDGSFTMTSNQRSGSGRRRVTVQMTVTGRIEGDRATGTVSSVTSVAGRRVCGGQTTFTSFRGGPPPGAGPALPAPGSILRGTVAPAARSLYDIVFRVSADGRSITRANVSLPYNCRRRRGRRQQGSQIFYERGGTINADGTFRLSDTYRLRWRQGVERGRVTIQGRFVEGGAIGTVQMSSTTRKGRSVYDRCVSGRQPFAARL
jgi:hypothetical protein